LKKGGLTRSSKQTRIKTPFLFKAVFYPFDKLISQNYMLISFPRDREQGRKGASGLSQMRKP